MKQTVTIEVEVPDGFEVVDFREPDIAAEHWIDYTGGHCRPSGSSSLLWAGGQRFILRPIWQPQPITLKPGWVFQFRSESHWYWTDKEPSLSKDGSHWCTPTMISLTAATNFTPPPCTDWRTSLRQIGGGA